MGLIKHLLFWPVTGPSFLARFSMEKVHESVRRELTDDQSIKEELLALQMEYELGDMDDEEYAARETALMRQLREVRHWREEFGMGVSGGPVRVSREEVEEPNEEEAEEAKPHVATGSDSAEIEVGGDWNEG